MGYFHVVAKAANGLSQGSSFFSHWLQSDDSDIEDGNDICAALLDAVSDNILPQIMNVWSLGRIDWTYYPGISEAPYPTQVYTFSAVTGGFSAGEPLPPRMTMLIEYKALTQSVNRKRTYIGRYAEAQNESPGVPTVAITDALIAYAANTVGELPIGTRTYHWAVCRLDAEGVTVQAYSRLTSYLVQRKWAYLRSRDAGRGV